MFKYSNTRKNRLILAIIASSIINIIFISYVINFDNDIKNKKEIEYTKIQEKQKEEKQKQKIIEDSDNFLNIAKENFNNKNYIDYIKNIKTSLEFNINKNNLLFHIKSYNQILTEKKCDIINLLNLTEKEFISFILKYKNFDKNFAISVKNKDISSIINTYDFQILIGKQIDKNIDIEYILNNVTWVDSKQNKLLFVGKVGNLKGKSTYFSEEEQNGYYSINKNTIYLSFGKKTYKGKLEVDGKLIFEELNIFNNYIICK